MTEPEWLACGDPTPMLRLLGKASERKLRLFAVACCRQFRGQMGSERYRQAVEVAERYAEGQANWKELRTAYSATRSASTRAAMVARWAAHATTYARARTAAWSVARLLTGPSAGSLRAPAVVCDFLRDIFGTESFRPVDVIPSWLTWQGGAVQQMAQAIYEERRIEDLPVLADALEEAGCTDPDILSHCRFGGEHVRGCWVLDLLLNKE